MSAAPTQVVERVLIGFDTEKFISLMGVFSFVYVILFLWSVGFFARKNTGEQ